MKTLIPKKLISAILATAVLSVAPIYASAYDIIDTEENIVLPISDLPEMIDREEAISRGHIQRLKSEEPDLHSVVFLNSDGTKSLYMFASPVKYVANDGTVKDKRTQLNQTLTNFSSTDNDVNVNISRISSNGASISNENETVTMIPAGSGNNKIGLLSNNSAMFNEVFGNDTALYYTPLLSGVKAGIVLKSYSGQNEFTFDITANGLLPITTENGLICLNNSDGEAIFEIGTFVATDANGNHFESEMILSGNTASGFKITSEVDESFLESENTAYPVIIEQSISLNTSSAIDDALVYSGKPTRTYGSYKYNNIGYLDSSYKIGRLFVKFPALESNSTFLNLKVGQITNAQFCMFTASSGYDYYFSIYSQQSVAWEESSITWSSMFYNNPSENFFKICTKQAHASAAQATSFDITSLVKKWTYKPSYRQKGFFIKNISEDNATYVRDFCSTEYANANNGNLMPYLTITYSSVKYIPVKLNVYYDESFVQINKNIYPALTDSTACYNRIAALVNPVCNMYRQRFGIDMYINYVYQTTTSIDSCVNSNDFDEICDEYSNCSNHHTNVYEVFDSVPNGNHQTAINVFFTGHATCAYDAETGGCKEDIIHGMANPNDCKAAIFKTTISNTSKDTYIRMVIAHELGHLYGTPDHYENDEQGQNTQCIWGVGNEATYIYENLIICDNCENIIHKNFNIYNHA